jgi:hypothetical protein
MRRLMIAGLLLTGLIVTAAAQDIDRLFDNDKVRQDLSLTDKEVQDLKNLWNDTQKQMELARADREVRASELKRLLLETPVNMSAVQKSLRDAMDVEYRLRLAQIDRAVKAKEILGDKRWADLQKMMRGLAGRMRGMNRDNRRPNAPNGPNRPRNMQPPRNN